VWKMPGTGDALGGSRMHKDGVSLWWKVTNRNKKDHARQRHARGPEDARRLVAGATTSWSRIFELGTLDEWGYAC